MRRTRCEQAALMVGILFLVGSLGGCRDRSETRTLADASPVDDATHVSQAAAASPSNVTPTGPFLRAVGTAQDGGFPHAACHHDLCRRARQEPRLARLVASLALVLPGEDAGAEHGRARVYLVDATPDVRAQLDRLIDVRPPPEDRVDRAPVDGVLLTHAHIGHYLGLAFFGFEAVHSQAMPVYCTPRMAAFLRGHGPWSQLVSLGNVALREQAPGSRFDLGPVTVEMLQVPHRDELSDTVAYVFHGPARSALYVPDTDAWSAWPESLETVIDRLSIDIALLDATFYSLDELPGRDLASVPHPLITQSMDLLQDRVEAGTLAVYFTHLNHSNPALDPTSAARSEIERRGFAVLAEGQDLAL